MLRRRQTLEEAGLLERVGVDVHPDPQAPASAYPQVGFAGLGLRTNHPFDLAYAAALEFVEALGQRSRAGGLIKTMLLQRICSSFASGQATAERLLRKEALDEDESPDGAGESLGSISPAEALHLGTIVSELSRPEARDPKLHAVLHFLTAERSEGKTWLEHGCIVFSQYYDTALSMGASLAARLPGEPVAVYAGAGKSGLFNGAVLASVGREEIKARVKERRVRLVLAIDAACEGLNLQTLGTLINVDLPWNPSRLEQRLGRIKRFGQARRSVDMLNLVYAGTQDERVYQARSRRMKDRYDLFGGLPDTIEDDWIENVERLEAMMDEYVHLRRQARDVFELRYQATIDPDRDRWELCSRVLSRGNWWNGCLCPGESGRAPARRRAGRVSPRSRPPRRRSPRAGRSAPGWRWPMAASRRSKRAGRGEGPGRSPCAGVGSAISGRSTKTSWRGPDRMGMWC